jgi:palmitoyl-protein thioesterase
LYANDFDHDLASLIQIIRRQAFIQQCPQAKVKNLVTLGGQYQGVFGLPNCPSFTTATCEYLRKILNFAAYAGWVQRLLVQATYWHDPLNEHAYRSKRSFLSEINNEKKIKTTSTACKPSTNS